MLTNSGFYDIGKTWNKLVTAQRALNNSTYLADANRLGPRFAIYTGKIATSATSLWEEIHYLIENGTPFEVFLEGVKKMRRNEKSMKDRIQKLLLNTGYELISFRYDSKTFGNMIINIAGKDNKINIVTDRGEVYFNDKAVYYPLVSPLEVETIEIVVAVLLRDYLMVLRKLRDLSNYKLTD